jgi:acyl-CoA synthetase (AMP-forming)/AMP-acid ligase II
MPLIFRTTPTDRTVIEAVVDAAKIQGWRRVAVEDPVTGKLSYRKLLVGARLLAAKFLPLADKGEAVGVMLPNANGGAATLLGMMSAGRVPAMINFSAGVANIHAACTAAAVRTIVTSRGFVERARLDKLVGALAETVRIVYLEDLRETISIVDKARALIGYRRALVSRNADNPAAILFTSGSEGMPKGCGALPSEHAVQCGSGRGAHRFRPQRQGLQHAAGVPRLRAHSRLGSAARVRSSGFSLPLAAALPGCPRAGLRHERDDPVRH